MGIPLVYPCFSSSLRPVRLYDIGRYNLWTTFVPPTAGISIRSSISQGKVLAGILDIGDVRSQSGRKAQQINDKPNSK